MIGAARRLAGGAFLIGSGAFGRKIRQ